MRQNRSESQYRPYRPDDMLTPATAAALARRSVRTIRRAYKSGALLAYRDGSGRSVRIRYADLRDWLMSEPAASPARRPPASARPLRSSASRGGTLTENLALLRAARAARARRAAGSGRGASSSAA